MTVPQTPPGWYPTTDGRRRYWDGSRWMEDFQPPPGQAPPPPKSGGALKWVLITLGVVLVLGLGSCIAFIAAVGSGTSSAMKSLSAELESSAPSVEPSTASTPLEAETAAPTPTPPVTSDNSGDENNPVVIKPGKAFEIRGFNYAKGWKITDSGFGMFTVENLKVTNNRGEKDSAWIDLKFWKGSEVLAEVTCMSSPIFPGTTVTLDCSSLDELPKKYDKLTVNDTF